MKQETIGPRGAVPGFRPLIGEERWHRYDFTDEMLSGGWRPLLLGEKPISGDQIMRNMRDKVWHTFGDKPTDLFDPVDSVTYNCRTKRPLPTPAVETFEAHGHIWYKHTPGDDAPIEPDASCVVMYRNGNTSNSISYSSWKNTQMCIIIGYRFPDYPAVHTTLQQEQQTAQPPTATIPTQFSTEQRLTSLYNDWCFLPPETVAECIADVASVLYPTDAERCEAAFQRWFNEWGYPGVAKGATDIVWHAAWKAAKESKV